MKPILSKELSSEEFNEYYYLKDELINFCHENGLKSTGKKTDLERRISKYLEKQNTNNTITGEKSSILSGISLDDKIGNQMSSQENRELFEDCKDSTFSFNINNNVWFKNHPDTTYENAFQIFHGIHNIITKSGRKFRKQYQYNKYVKDFLKNNPEATFDDAVHCWKNNKNLKKSSNYDDSELMALVNQDST